MSKRRRTDLLRILLAGLALLVLAAAPLGLARAQQVGDDLWVTDAPVLAVARSESTLYIGGSFNAVGPCTGSGVPLSRRTGVPVSAYPKVAGTVLAVAADGAGGWYIGGAFVGVGGLPRANLAHILPGGQVAPWKPDPDGPIHTMALACGRLYVGGQFTRIAGQTRSCAAAFRLGDGSPTSWDPHPEGTDGSADLAVRSILPRGRTIFVGGHFLAIGGESRTHLAAVDADWGRATDWNPQANYTVRALAERGETLYVGGEFHVIGGAQRRLLAALSVRTGAAGEWNPGVFGSGVNYDASPYVGALTLSGNSVFVAGHFARVAGQVRGGVAELELTTGEATPWNPSPVFEGSDAPYIWAVAVHGQSVYVGGRFRTFGGLERLNIASVDAGIGQAESWNPGATGDVHVIAVRGDAIFVGGEFGSMGNVHFRRGVAALDARTGAVTPWNPGMWGFTVQALAVSGETVYAGGIFFRMGGEWRNNIAAVDARTGRVTDWDPEAFGGYNGSVNAIAVKAGTVYLGGGFTAVGGELRSYLAAVDSVTGRATAWNPAADDIVNCLRVQGSRMYVGGWFNTIGGQRRTSIAALDLSSGRATDWDPDGNGIVTALALGPGVVYAGGSFETMGGRPRHSLAAIDQITGVATDWDPDPHGPFATPEIEALALAGNTLYAGGAFTSMGGEARSYIAGVDATSGVATPWNAGTDGWIWALTEYDGTVYVGGNFARMGLIPRANLAAIDAAAWSLPGVPSTQPVILAQNAPNPVRSSAVIRFTLPAAAPVSLAVYDVQGRRVASLLDHELRPAGRHEVAVRTDGWPEGFYFYRLESGGEAARRKMLVIR